MKFLLSFLILFIAINSEAQVDPVGDYNRHVASNWKGEFARIGPYRVKGTPHFYGVSLPGTITYKAGRKESDKKIFYDIYHHKIGTDLNEVFIDVTESVQEFFVELPEAYGGKHITFKPTSAYATTPALEWYLKNHELKGYFEVLTDGNKASFLKYYKIAVVPDPVNIMDKESRVFEQRYEYYIFNKINKELHKVKLKEKDILKALGNDNNLKIVGSSNVSFYRESEVSHFISQYNIH